MTISVTCPNGHKLKAKDSHAGRSLPCPACGAKIVVPTPQAEPPASPAPLETMDLSSPLGSSEDFFTAQAPVVSPYAPAPVSRPATPSPAPKQPSSNLTLYLLIGGAVGGSGLAIVLAVVAWLILTRGGTEVASNEAATPASSAITEPTGPGSNAAPIDPAAINQQVTETMQKVVGSIENVLAGKQAGSENIPEITEKLRQIALAFHNFHDTHRMFALPRLRDSEVLEPNRRPPPTALSWRVHLLPYLDQRPLYEHFHLDEPWDSPHNITLLDKMPEVYRIGSAAGTATRFQVITGPDALFGRPVPAQFRDVADGARHTILAIVAGPDRAIPWTQPDELTLDPSQPIASLGAMPDNLIKCVMVDGKPLILRDNIEPASFLALTTPGGKEIVDAETFRRQFEEERQDALENRVSGLVGLTPTPASPGTAPPNSSAPSSSVTGTVAGSSSPAQLLAITAERMKKLKEIVLAMHNYHDTYRQLPISKNSKFYDQEGKPFLSWRVHLLPFLDQQPLYDQFKLDEPWDSAHNRSLVDKMPDIFRDPQDQVGGVKTRFVTLTGPDTVFSKPQGPSFRDFTDGTSTTLLIVMCGADKAVSWTQPEDIAFDPNSPVGCLGTLTDPVIFYARADGAVKVLQSSVPPELFKVIVTPAGGEMLSKEFASFEVR